MAKKEEKSLTFESHFYNLNERNFWRVSNSNLNFPHPVHILALPVSARAINRCACFAPSMRTANLAMLLLKQRGSKMRTSDSQLRRIVGDTSLASPWFRSLRHTVSLVSRYVSSSTWLCCLCGRLHWNTRVDRSLKLHFNPTGSGKCVVCFSVCFVWLDFENKLDSAEIWCPVLFGEFIQVVVLSVLEKKIPDHRYVEIRLSIGRFILNLKLRQRTSRSLSFHMVMIAGFEAAAAFLCAECLLITKILTSQFIVQITRSYSNNTRSILQTSLSAIYPQLSISCSKSLNE